ncbi:MAG: hypothetical protein UZ16_OP3001003589 [Candidatus Hinthialibacteria bacterium OLB16]|nr:MAG: hypothetical protein UZ16_OP3001003589 [Candidatus Hinthialibacteria bacterium OLB16]
MRRMGDLFCLHLAGFGRSLGGFMRRVSFFGSMGSCSMIGAAARTDIGLENFGFHEVAATCDHAFPFEQPGPDQHHSILFITQADLAGFKGIRTAADENDIAAAIPLNRFGRDSQDLVILMEGDAPLAEKAGPQGVVEVVQLGAAPARSGFAGRAPS